MSSKIAGRAGVRRLVLAGAVALAIVVWVVAPSPAPSIAESYVIGDTYAAEPAKGATPASESAAKAEPPAPGPGSASPSATAPASRDAAPGASGRPSRGIGVGIEVKGDDEPAGDSTHTTKIRIDKDFDSMESFMQDGGWIAGLVFFTVMLVFAVPVLIVALVIWYRLRRTRMVNEAIVKLAEQGAIAHAAALDALANGRAPPPPNGSPATPAYDLPKTMVKRAARSDLRTGVICGAVGLAFTLYWFFNGRHASFIGLILLFVGIAFCALWWFERPKPAGAATPPPGSV
jgi:hypothetical protein